MTRDENPDPIPRIACPVCGAEMNPHAEKLVAAMSASEAGTADPALGGLIEQVHQCPACGNVTSRRLPPVARAS